MKILLVVHQYWPEYFAGTENYTHNIAQELSRQGHEVGVFTTYDDHVTPYPVGKVFEYKEGEVQVFKAQTKRSMKVRIIDTLLNDDYISEFKTVIDKFKPDIVHIQHLLNMTLSFIDVLVERNIPVVYSIHDLWFKCPTFRGYVNGSKCLCTSNEASMVCVDMIMNGYTPYRIRNFLIKLLVKFDFKIQRRNRNTIFRKYLNMTQAVIVPSQFLNLELNQFGIEKSKIRYIQHGIILPEDKLRNQKRSGDKIRFVFASHLTSEKGFNATIDLFLKLSKKNRNIELDIYGSYQKQSKEIIDYLALIKEHKQITYKGNYNPQDTYEVLSKYDVVLVPSLWDEIYGLIVDEALALNKFVITSNKGSLPERIIHGENGLIFDPDIKNDYLVKVKEVISNFTEYKNKSARVDNTYVSIENHVKTLVDLYKSL